MTLFSFHLAELAPSLTGSALLRPSTAAGLEHIEALALMRLGAPVISPARLQLRRCAVFAAWRHDDDLQRFLLEDRLGRGLAAGWHVRMEFVRRWGRLAALSGLPERAGRLDPDEPTVAVTVARMRIPELPRFLHWGRPVERQVRDDPATTLAVAAIRPPRTVCTFSVWQSVRAMVSMVHGRGDFPQSGHHAAGMAERERRDFHHEFVTLRFRPLSEHGSWQGRRGFIPQTTGP